MFLVASFKEDTPLKSSCKCQGVLKIPLFNFRFISKEPADYVAHQSTHTRKRKTFGECVEVAQKDYQVSKGYYPKQRDSRCWRGCRVRAGTARGLLQGVGKLCVGKDRRSSCAAFRRGSSEELVSLAGSAGQEAPWQQQGQGSALTREALGLDRDAGPRRVSSQQTPEQPHGASGSP